MRKVVWTTKLQPSLNHHKTCWACIQPKPRNEEQGLGIVQFACITSTVLAIVGWVDIKGWTWLQCGRWWHWQKMTMMTMTMVMSWYQWYDNNLASMRHASLQCSPDIWYKDVLQKTSLQLLCKDVLQKTVIEEVALNYQLSTVVSQGMTDSRVIKQFKGENPTR